MEMSDHDIGAGLMCKFVFVVPPRSEVQVHELAIRAQIFTT